MLGVGVIRVYLKSTRSASMTDYIVDKFSEIFLVRNVFKIHQTVCSS